MIFEDHVKPYVYPSFGKRIMFEWEETGKHESSDVKRNDAFIRELPIHWHEYDFYGGSELTENRKTCQMIINVGQLSPPPFPQSYTFTLSARDDLFHHLTHKCTPFSFRTTAERQNLSLKGEDVFRRIGRIVKELVTNVMEQNDRYKADLCYYRKDDYYQLHFLELVMGCRKAHLISFDFRHTPWENVAKDVQTRYNYLKSSIQDTKSRLVRVLDVVQSQAPSLLLSLNAPKTSLLPAEWLKTSYHFAHHASNSSDAKEGHRFINHILTPKDVQYEKGQRAEEVIFQRTIPIVVNKFGSGTNELSTKLFTVSILGANPNPTHPRYYRIIVLDPNNILFHLTSDRITREKWNRMTAGKFNGTTPGFWPDDGIGGFLGIVGGECLRGCNTTGRFTAKLTLRPNKSSEISPSAIIIDPCELEQVLNVKAKLTFTEKLIYSEHEIFSVYLEEGPNDSTRNIVRERVKTLERDYETTIGKLSSLLTHIRERKPGLLLHIPRVPSITQTRIDIGSGIRKDEWDNEEHRWSSRNNRSRR